MNKIVQVKEFLQDIGMPNKQRTEVCALTFLAMAGIKLETPWSSATNQWLRIHDIIQFISVEYNVTYAENSRETIRKQALHEFRTAALIEDNGVATNSPNYRYRVTQEVINIIRSIGSSSYRENLNIFFENHNSLIEIYASKKKMQMYPVNINGQDFSFSSGLHNQLQKSVIEEFAPRFAPNSMCLYVGDSTDKNLFKNDDKLKELGFLINTHEKMPDIVLYREDKDWIYFIECVTSVGPINSKRIAEISAMTKNVRSGKVFVTAFLNMKTSKKFISEIAWETEIWIADNPDHLIHMNGDRFLGPRN